MARPSPICRLPDRRAALFPEAADADWSDWRWQARHMVSSLDALAVKIPLTEDEREGVRATAEVFRLGITPYYLALVDPARADCPIRRQAIPVRDEARIRPGELRDPLGEDQTRPTPAIVHRYPDRVLLLATDRCTVYCRHCTRRRITGGGEGELDRSALREAVAYLRGHPEVRDVLISGGDPLLLSDGRLEELLADVASVPSIQMIRIGTRIPVTCPMRVTPALAALLRRFAPLFVVTHFNHPREVTAEAALACERLVDAGVPVENQTVLLRRVNSSARTLLDLNHRLLMLRVRPYYLHQGDVAEGLEHLRTPLEAGLEILSAMRGHTSGLAVPHLAVDLPGGGGKVTLQPDYVVERGERAWTFENFLGKRYDYPQPEVRDCSCPWDDEVFYAPGGGGVPAQGEAVKRPTIEPASPKPTV
ncbi:MAG TPA: KamA family radical SAM protein [Myxococcales bacterium]|nr:KamA family radical SAM protein [Myxococcales bacterium]